jgi:hypothetical protein
MHACKTIDGQIDGWLCHPSAFRTRLILFMLCDSLYVALHCEYKQVSTAKRSQRSSWVEARFFVLDYHDNIYRHEEEEKCRVTMDG